MIINKGNLQTLETAFKAAFNAGFSSLKEQELPHLMLATTVPSNTKQNYYGFLGQFPKFQQWVGDRVLKSLSTHDYTLANLPFETTVEVSRDDIEDDQYGVYTPMMENLGYAARVHPTEILFDLIAAGHSTLCYDGQYFFDTDHPVGAGTVSNYDATGAGAMWILADLRRPLKPFILQMRTPHKFTSFAKDSDEHVFMTRKFIYGSDARLNVGFGLWQQAYASLNTLNSTNFQTYVAAMAAFKSDEGRPLGIMPTHLICGPSNRAAAETLLKAQFGASGASNIHFGAVDLIVTPYMT
jgi:phage major head subunit gpT-like protein